MVLELYRLSIYVAAHTFHFALPRKTMQNRAELSVFTILNSQTPSSSHPTKTNMTNNNKKHSGAACTRNLINQLRLDTFQMHIHMKYASTLTGFVQCVLFYFFYLGLFACMYVCTFSVVDGIFYLNVYIYIGVCMLLCTAYTELLIAHGF